MTVDRDIDVVGKACPLPLVTIAKEVRTMKPGQTLRITGNDPIFEESMVEFCRTTGHVILQTDRQGKTVRMIIRV